MFTTNVCKNKENIFLFHFNIGFSVFFVLFLIPIPLIHSNGNCAPFLFHSHRTHESPNANRTQKEKGEQKKDSCVCPFYFTTTERHIQSLSAERNFDFKFDSHTIHRELEFKFTFDDVIRIRIRFLKIMTRDMRA